MENPYFHRTAIRDDRYFFGRTQETRRIMSLVARGQPVSIVGPRRIGKSSLLFHLCDPCVRAAHGLCDDYVCVRIDCQALSGDLTRSDVYRKLLEAIELALGGPRVEHSSQERMTYLHFEKHLDEITSPDVKIVVLFDEFEAMAGNARLNEDFFTELRGLGEQGRVVYVTASGETLYELSFQDENTLSSPFFNFFTMVRLGLMKPEEARDLIDRLAAMPGFGGFDEGDHAFLRKIAGTHPFYLQVACYCLFEEKAGGDSSTAPDYDRVRRQFAIETRDYFQYVWKRLSRDQQEALKQIGEGHLDSVTAGDLERLEQKCLVCQGRIFSSVFADFVAHEMERATPVVSEDAVEGTMEVGGKRQVRITKPPLVITEEDLRKFGMD